MQNAGELSSSSDRSNKKRFGTLIAQRPLALFVALSLILVPTVAIAGDLVIYNTSPASFTCLVDGYTTDTGDSVRVQFKINPGERFNIPPSLTSETKMINWVDCGNGLRTRAMNLTVDGPDGVLFLTGQQKRTLNVNLYASIPTDPAKGYASLVRGLTLAYQAKHPEILLNLVLNTGIDTYNFKTLQAVVFGKNGFDVVEIDTVVLDYLVRNQMITETAIKGDEPWPAAKEAATIDGKLYGVPSWLCSDFLFSANNDLASVQTFADLQRYMKKMPKGRRQLVGVLNGTWTIPALYLQAFVQTHPNLASSDALKMPADPQVIDRMVQFGTDCTINGGNPCTDNRYHDAADGSVERAFANGEAPNDLGFSERSFLLVSDTPTPENLSVIPLPWGDAAGARVFVYSDAFVTNKKTCDSAPCQDDSREFSAFMTSVDIKKYITFSADLPYGAPPRHLLAATKRFYEDDDVKGDWLYSRVVSTFLEKNPRAYPNTFSPQSQYDLLLGICTVLNQKSPHWKCKIPKKPN